MNLYENELIRKYFWPEKCLGVIDCQRSGMCDYCVKEASLLMVEAIQAPIKRGDKILEICSDLEIVEEIAAKDMDYLHPIVYRAPSRFQDTKTEIDRYVDLLATFVAPDDTKAQDFYATLEDLIRAVRRQTREEGVRDHKI